MIIFMLGGHQRENLHQTRSGSDDLKERTI